MHRGLAALIALVAVLAGLALFTFFPARNAGWVGQVLGEDGPLGGARVRWQATGRSTETDACGRFSLAGPPAARLTVWKVGYFIGGLEPNASPLSLQLKPLPNTDHAEYRWTAPDLDPDSPRNCGNCHGEIHREWQASGHSRSATSRHFRNLYEGTDWHGRPGVGWGLLTQHPDGAGVCTSCHAPAVSDDDPAALDLRLLEGTAARGVHCDYCHKIAGTDRAKVGLTHGRFNLHLLRPDPRRQLFFGPLDDVDRGEDAYSPLYCDSLYCASCHEGTVFGVHAYSTYSEWLDSPARQQGQHCQHCHMKPTGRMTNFAPGRGGLERDPATLANHLFFAGSQQDMLRACLRLDLEAQPGPDQTLVQVHVGVQGVGHRVPTGLPDRQLLVVMEGRDAAARLLAPRTGPTLPPWAGRELAGRPGRLYAKLLHSTDGQRPAPFWSADPDPDDNRLTPHRADRLTFAYPAALCTLRVRVLYRRFWDQTIQSKGWPNRDLVVLERDLAIRQTFPATE
jgi:hypothetical protein